MVATNALRSKIIVSKGDDGGSPQIDVNMLSNQIEKDSQDDLSSTTLVGYTGGHLIAQLNLRGHPDGLFVLNSKTGEVESLFSWNQISRSSQITADGHAILAVTSSPDSLGCQPTSGHFTTASATEDTFSYPDSCFVVIDLEKRQGQTLSR
jgi:hypothetical protein